MLLYAWMLLVETAPERYDVGMKIMTMGKIDKLKDIIAEKVNSGENVLDIGCGTGTLAVRCLKKGATVTGIDSSEFMLVQARKNAEKEGLSGKFRTIKDSATQLKKYFKNDEFDIIMSSLSFGEFPKSYLEYIFEHCSRMIKKGGRLIIADELQPENKISRFFYNIIMGILWLPQFLIVRRVAFPIKGLPQLIEKAGFTIEERIKIPFSNYHIIFARKK